MDDAKCFEDLFVVHHQQLDTNLEIFLGFLSSLCTTKIFNKWSHYDRHYASMENQPDIILG